MKRKCVISYIILKDRRREDMEKTKQGIIEYLGAEGIEFEVFDYKENFDNMQQCSQIANELSCNIFKNLFLQNRQGTEYFLLLMSANKKFRTADISKQIDKARLSFGNDEKLYEYLGVKPGSITPLGLVFDQNHQVRVLIDEDLLNENYVGVHPLINNSIVKIRMSDILEIVIRGTGHNYTTVKMVDYLT